MRTEAGAAIRGILCFFLPAAVPRSTLTPCSSIGLGSDFIPQVSKETMPARRPAQHPVPSSPPPGHFPGLFCSARTRAGPGDRERTSLTCQPYVVQRQSVSGARDDGRGRLSCPSGLSAAAFPPLHQGLRLCSPHQRQRRAAPGHGAGPPFPSQPNPFGRAAETGTGRGELGGEQRNQS